MEIPFDNNSGEKYNLEVHENELDSGDGVVLKVNRKSCLALAKIFNDLAEKSEKTHIHLGYDHEEPQGPGFRIELTEDI